MVSRSSTSDQPRSPGLAGDSPSSPLPANPGQPLSPHIPALDAVRGLAILMVTAFRFFPAYDDPSLAGRLGARVCEFGGRGVDLFFVLSGFLITGILWDTKVQSHYFRNFYARRALRIFPLYYGALLLVLIVLPAFGQATSSEFACGEEYSPWLWFYGSNFLMAWKGEWCLGAFNHFWSLAVEEHFYLVWPLVIFYCSRTAAIRVCLAAMALSILARAAWLYSGGNEVATQVFTLFRIDALALGGVLALYVRGPNGIKKLRPWAIGCCVLMFIAMLPPIHLHRRFPALRETMYALLFGGVIILAITTAATGWWGRMWNAPILRFFGKYSYGMYVVQNFLKAAFPPELVIAGIAAGVGSIFWSRCSYLALMSVATLLGALLSWNLLEKHFLRFKSHFEYTKATAAPDEAASPKNHSLLTSGVPRLAHE
jgi:peptidoglycan/LPS O-acetylase OafA/YrhL